MRIAFIQFVHYEYLGIMYLSSSLKKHGHAVEVFICQGNKKSAAFVDEIAKYQPDIVAFSVMSGTEELALSIARLAKKRMNVYSIFGGPHPTVMPEIIEHDCVDCVCIGESEGSVAAIANSLAAGKFPEKVPGAWFKINGKIIKNELGVLELDINKLPRPDRSLYRDKYRSLRNRQAGFITGRGCPFHCTFCASTALMKLYRGKGPYVRQRSVPDVIDEVREVISAYDIKTVYFRDDTFILNKSWAFEFCDAYQREIGLPFSCHIRADLITEELIAALVRANCKTVSFGVETGSIRTRSLLLKKEVSDEQIINCAGLLRKNGILFRTYNILGLPGETLEDAFQTVALNARIKSDFPWCSLFQPMPGTELWEYCKTNAIFDGGTVRTQPSFFKDSSLVLKNKNEIVNLQKLFVYAVKFPVLKGVIRRAIRLRPNAGYELLFTLAHGWAYFRSNLLSVSELMQIGFMNIARYLPKKT